MLFALFLIGLSACKDNEVKDVSLPKGTTYMGLSIAFPKSQSKMQKAPAPDNGNYNSVGIYAGYNLIDHLDIYLLSSDGNTLIESRRFGTTQLTVRSEDMDNDGTDDVDYIKLLSPFKTTPGDKMLIVVLNCPLPILSTVLPYDYRYILSSSLPLSSLAKVDFNSPSVNISGHDIYPDLVVMSGKTTTFNIQDGVSAEDVRNYGTNLIAADITRVPSRVIMTSSASSTVTDATGSVLGTISDVTYSVAQGGNSVYLFPQTDGTGTVTTTWGYTYVPGVDYTATAAAYYDYSDLQNTTNTVSVHPGDNSYSTFPGKFLLENTHPIDGYRKGNTAYVLVRAKFTPTPGLFADGGAPDTDGTFYVGGTDGHFYSSIANAQDYTIGTYNQPVLTYTEGKALYYVWLNPDNTAKPTASPVIRNNIYHIKINAFKNLGVNWNPLTPDVYNPDPKPTGPEPETPINPTDPLSSTDTYMSVDIQLLPWTIHTYSIDL